MAHKNTEHRCYGMIDEKTSCRVYIVATSLSNARRMWKEKKGRYSAYLTSTGRTTILPVGTILREKVPLPDLDSFFELRE